LASLEKYRQVLLLEIESTLKYLVPNSDDQSGSVENTLKFRLDFGGEHDAEEAYGKEVTASTGLIEKHVAVSVSSSK
jgi:hypothetical protein